MDWIKDAYNETMLKVNSLKSSDVEKMVINATSNANCGISSTLKHKISDATNDEQHFTEIITILWKRIGTKTGSNWRIIFKSLELLIHLIIFGHERVVDFVKKHRATVQPLRDFHYFDPETGNDKGRGIRTLSMQILKLLNNSDALKQQQTESRKRRQKLYRMECQFDASTNNPKLYVTSSSKISKYSDNNNTWANSDFYPYDPYIQNDEKHSKQTERQKQLLREEIINFRKISYNSKCADCSVNHPQYIVMNFGIFVCTNCSSIHLKFTHRIKSILLDDWNKFEVQRVKSMGNNLINAQYLATYDSNKHFYNDSNRDRLIKSKYIDKKWYDSNASPQLNKKKHKKKKSKKNKKRKKLTNASSNNKFVNNYFQDTSSKNNDDNVFETFDIFDDIFGDEHKENEINIGNNNIDPFADDIFCCDRFDFSKHKMDDVKSIINAHKHTINSLSEDKRCLLQTVKMLEKQNKILNETIKNKDIEMNKLKENMNNYGDIEAYFNEGK